MMAMAFRLTELKRKGRFRRRKLRGSSERNKMHTVMHEFKMGKLRSSSGFRVASRKQAVAIGMSEARRMRAH